MANYETQLNNLKEAQKRAAQADLENTRNSALSDLASEESKLNPAYDAKRTQTSNASKVNARNFQEYLANTGRANSGIGAQYEMGRQNSLNRDLNALNAAQAQDVADIARRRTLANDVYNSGLASANATIEANYIQNLLQQQQQEWENNMALKQFNEQVRQFNLSRSGYGGSYSGGGGNNPKSVKSPKSPKSPQFTGTKLSDNAKKLLAAYNNAKKYAGSRSSSLMKKGTTSMLNNYSKASLKRVLDAGEISKAEYNYLLKQIS